VKAIEMTARLLKVGLMIYLVLMALGVLFAISSFDFHEHFLGIAGLLSVLSLTIAAAYRQVR
jgi:hypothetical protein